jgi:hypothetical protein
MSFRPDARSRLRNANPVSSEDAPSPDSPQARALAARIMATPLERPRTRRQRSSRATTLKVLVPVIAVAALAATLRPSHSITDPLSVACFEGPTLDSGLVTLAATGRDPVAACRELWQPGHAFHTANGVVPARLVPCLFHGGLAIFPTNQGDICDELQLAHPDNGTPPDVALVRAATDAIATQFTNVCMQASGATEFIKQVLDEHHLSGWQVMVTGEFSGGTPCATAAVDAYDRIVTVTPTRYVAPP